MKLPTLLQTPEFWAAHYYLYIAEEEADSPELVEPIFGLSDDAVVDFYFSQLVQPDGEAPLAGLSLELLDGYSALIQFADLGDSGHETRYFLTHPSWPTPLLLGYESPHFALPAFRWAEMEHLRRAVSAGSDPSHAAAACLLLFPSVYLRSEDDPDRVRRTLLEAWHDLGVLRPVEPEHLVTNIVAYRSVEVEWSSDPNLGWVCNGRYSLRNPHSSKTSPADFARLAGFFDALDRAL